MVPGAFLLKARTQTDDVYFDNNSFTAPGQTVTVNSAAACRNMDWTGSTSIYTGAVQGPAMNITTTLQLDILGNFKLSAGMRGFTGTNLRFIKDNATVSLDPKGIYINCRISFDALNGNFQLQSSLSAFILYVNRGVIYSNNNGIYSFSIVIAGTTGVNRGLVLGTSAVTLNNNGSAAFSCPSDLATDPALVMSCASSTINLAGNNPSFTFSDIAFNKINVSSSGVVAFTAKPNGTSIRHLVFSTTAKCSFSLGKYTITDSLILAPGGTYGINTSNITLTSAAVFSAVGNCQSKIQLFSNLVYRSSSSVPITKIGGWGSSSMACCNVQGIKFMGGGLIHAIQSFDLGGNSFVNFDPVTPLTYYWVNGTGYWNAGTNWALSSGGSPTGCVPGPLDNVVFDASSFSAPSQQVIVADSSDTYCASMNWAGVTAAQRPIFTNILGAIPGVTMNIRGSLTASKNMVWNLQTPVTFSGSSNQTIKSDGITFLKPVVLSSVTGIYALADSMKVNAGFYLTAGYFNSNNKNLYTREFSSTGNIYRVLDLGTSRWYLSNHQTSIALQALLIGGVGFNLIASSSELHIQAKVNSFSNTYVLGGNNAFGKVYLENPSGFTPNTANAFYASGCSFELLHIENSVTFVGNASLNGDLELARSVFSFTSGAQYTFNGAATIKPIGTSSCSNALTLANTNSAPAVQFIKLSGTMAIDNVNIYGINALGGASFNANGNSIDQGYNTGWTFGTPLAARSLFWVGNSGNWSDAAHWSLSSGGPGGECIPTAQDSVRFDANSFTVTSQVVNLDQLNADCKYMSWVGVTNMPGMYGLGKTLNINGSVVLTNSMYFVAPPNVNFVGQSAAQTITSAGNSWGAVTINAASGNYTLTDSYSAGAFTLLSGGFNAANRNVTIGGFHTLGTANRNLILGTGKWTVTSVHPSTPAPYYNWLVANATGLAINTTGSSIYIVSPSATFAGGSFVYNLVDAQAAAPTATIGFVNNTINVLRSSFLATFDNNTFNDSLILKPGGEYRFAAGGTTYFADTACLYAIGSGSAMITLQSTSAGIRYTLQKNTGLVCTDFLNLYDSKAAGTAIYTAGANTIDRGNNAGWDFSPYPTPGAGALQPGVKCVGSKYALRFDITAGSFPMDIVLVNLHTGKFDTLLNVTSSPAYFMVDPLATNTFQVYKMIVQRCASVVTGPFNAVNVAVPAGSAGQWTNAAGSNNWFDCGNWGNGTVPDQTTNVNINGVAVCNINAQGAVCNDLYVQPGSQLNLNINSSLAIHNNIANGGIFNTTSGKVELAGSTSITLPANVNTFDSLVINKVSGLGVTLNPASDITVKKALVLNSGKINTGARSVLVTSNSPAAIFGHSGASYINGNITRTIAANGSYDFPVGSNTKYELSNVTTNNLTGVSTIAGRFDPFAAVSDSAIIPIAHYLVTDEYAKGMLDQGYWTLTPNAQPTAGDYSVTLRATGYTNPAAQQFRYILVKRDAATGFTWDINQGYNDPSLHVEAAGVVTAVRSSYTSFSQFAIAKLLPLSALSTRLISFYGTQTQQGNIINWTTADEQGQTTFMVERSSDGIIFQQLNVTGTQQLNGMGSYSYTDTRPVSNQHYYRLKVVLPDGSSYYSKTINLKGTKERIISIIAAEGSATVKVNVSGVSTDENLMFNLNDFSGRLILRKKIQAGSNEISISSLLQGAYIGQVTSNKYPTVVKRIVYNRK